MLKPEQGWYFFHTHFSFFYIATKTPHQMNAPSFLMKHMKRFPFDLQLQFPSQDFSSSLSNLPNFEQVPSTSANSYLLHMPAHNRQELRKIDFSISACLDAPHCIVKIERFFMFRQIGSYYRRNVFSANASCHIHTYRYRYNENRSLVITPQFPFR